MANTTVCQLSELHENATVPTQAVMRERINYLDALERFQTRDDSEFGRWADTRLDRWLVDWTLRNGYERTARVITGEKGIDASPFCLSFSGFKKSADVTRSENG